MWRNWVWVAALLALIAVFAYGMKVSSERCEAKRLEAVASALSEREAQYLQKQSQAEAVAQELEEQLLRQRTAIRVLQKRLQDEVHTNPVYRECKPTAGGVRSINAAIAARKGVPAR